MRGTFLPIGNLRECKRSVGNQSDQKKRKSVNRNGLFFILVIFLFIETNVFCQSELNRLVNYSLVHSRDIKKSNLDIELAKYIRKEVVGQRLPQVDGKASFSKMFLNMSTLLSGMGMSGGDMSSLAAKEPLLVGVLTGLSQMSGLYNTSCDVQVTQVIFSQSLLDGLKAAQKTQELYNALKTKTEEEVVEEVANNYYQALTIVLQLRTVEKSLANLNETYRIVNLNYQNDLTKESNVNRLKVNITNLDVTRQNLLNSYGLQLNYLKALAGMPGDTTFTIDTTALTNRLPVSNMAVPSFSAENVPAFQTLLKQDEVYKQQIKSSQAEYYPTLAVYGQLSYSSYNVDFKLGPLSNMSTIGAQLKVPIFKSGSQRAKVQQNKIKELQVQEDIAKAKDMLAVGYNNALSEYQNAIRLLSVQKDNRDLALKVYYQTALQYKEGVESLATLINVNSDFLQADNSYNQQILKCKLSEVKVMKASGSLKQLLSNNK